MSINLEIDGSGHGVERVHVLDLNLGPEPFASHGPYRHVDVASHGPFRQVPVAHVEVPDEPSHLRSVGGDFPARSKVGLGHDLDERDARAVVVRERVPRFASLRREVRELAGVFFDVRAGDADTFGASAVFDGDDDVEVSALRDWLVELRDLVALGQVRVEVLLAIELGPAPEGRGVQAE